MDIWKRMVIWDITTFRESNDVPAEHTQEDILSKQCQRARNTMRDYRRVKKYSYDQRKEYRLEKEKTVLDAFWTYLKDGHCSFSNNLSENVKANCQN